MEIEEKKEILEDESKTESQTPTETAVSATETAIATSRELAELDAYKRHTEALRIELSEIWQRFGDTDGENAIDPLKDIKAEMAEMKSGFAEIKAMFKELKSGNNSGNGNPPPVQNQSYYFQQPAPTMPTPIMPFYQTPNFQPIIPAIPTFNQR